MTELDMRTFVPDEMPPRDARRLMMSSIVPRPIAWVSTLGPDGVPNLAPYSFFNGVSGTPPVVMISITRKSQRFGGGLKDTLYNLQANGEFVINLVDETLMDAMNQTAGEWPYEVDEFTVANLKTAPSVDVQPPRVSSARVAMEARLHQIIPISDSDYTLVLGRIVRFHIREDLLRKDGSIDATRLQPVARLGGAEYTTLGNVFSLERPKIDPSA